MNKKQIIIGLAIVAAITPLAIRGQTVDDLRKQIENKESDIKRIEAEIAAYQKLLDGQENKSSSLKNEITRLETQIKKINADIRLTESRIQKTELRLSELASGIRTTEQKISYERDILEELVKAQFEADEKTLAEILLTGGSLADFFAQEEAVGTIRSNIQISLQNLHSEKNSLDTEKKQREDQEAELKALRKDLTGRKAVQENTSQSKSQLLKESKNQEAEYQKILKEREARRALIQKELETIEEALRKQIDPNSLPTKRTGVLGWPVANPVITQGFGFTQFATTQGSDIYKGKGHNGIDLRASIGTPILSAEDGTVKDLGNTDTVCPGGSYGKWIVVEHNNGLTTVYGHLSSVAATRGQKVKRGEIIAYSGQSGYVTGPHLHFTVWASNTYQYAKTRNCGLVPAGGYLNPMDYL